MAASLSFGGVILTEAALSFLGLGVNTLVPTWGKMIADSRDYMTLAWHLRVFPAVAIMLVVLGANLLGDWLRDVLRPASEGTARVASPNGVYLRMPSRSESMRCWTSSSVLNPATEIRIPILSS